MTDIAVRRIVVGKWGSERALQLSYFKVIISHYSIYSSQESYNVWNLIILREESLGTPEEWWGLLRVLIGLIRKYLLLRVFIIYYYHSLWYDCIKNKGVTFLQIVTMKTILKWDFIGYARKHNVHKQIMLAGSMLEDFSRD